MFMDVVGFTSMADRVPARQVMLFLNQLFGGLDDLLGTHDVHKIETAGDCYIVSAGVVDAARKHRDSNNTIARFGRITSTHDSFCSAAHVIRFSLAAVRHAASVMRPHNGSPTSVRIGVHTGSVVSGLIGRTLPKFGLFGDTMNVASRMEQTAPNGAIQISTQTYDVLSSHPDGADLVGLFHPTDGVNIKGKGTMRTWVTRAPEKTDRIE